MIKKTKTIYRVDDRFIHGQVIEGWIKYYHIPNIILVSDAIAADRYKRFIYESVLPVGSKLSIFSVDEFHVVRDKCLLNKECNLVILGSIEDLYKIISFVSQDDYINVGCLACGIHNIEVSDSVFLDGGECDILGKILATHDIFVHKLPWEDAVDMKDIMKKVCKDS